MTDPQALLTRIADALDAYWHTCLPDDWWPRVQSILEGDLAHRGRVVPEHGAAAMLSGLDNRLTWNEGRLRLCTRNFTVPAPWTDVVGIAGRGMVLLPTLFARGAEPLIDPAHHHAPTVALTSDAAQHARSSPPRSTPAARRRSPPSTRRARSSCPAPGRR